MKVSKNSRSIALALLCVSLCFSDNLSAQENGQKKKITGRDVQIQWNADAKQKKLKVIENDKLICDPQSYYFELRKNDRVLLIMQANRLKNKKLKLQIEYTITGLDVSARFSKRATEIWAKDETIQRGEIELERETVQVTDDLLPGGVLAVTFKKVLGEDEEETKIVKFRIKDEYPWFFSSVGMIITKAIDPEVAIVKTQTNEQIIVLKDNNTRTLHPLQSVVSFLNFRIYNPIYISLGFSLNQQIFTEPMIGLSYYFKVKNVGLVITLGSHFSKEVEIISSSGFKEGQSIDPTLNLTVEDIPTIEKYHTRFFFGFSLRF